VHRIVAMIDGMSVASTDHVLRGSTPLEAHLGQIERVDKHVDHANRVTLGNEISKSFGP
jgi:hypothetical protein